MDYADAVAVEGGDHRLDGNAAAGLLREIFEVEMTTARVGCGGCGAGGPLGAALVYASAIGTVVRCAGCGRSLIRITRVRGWCCVDIGGVASLRTTDGVA